MDESLPASRSSFRASANCPFAGSVGGLELAGQIWEKGGDYFLDQRCSKERDGRRCLPLPLLSSIYKGTERSKAAIGAALHHPADAPRCPRFSFLPCRLNHRPSMADRPPPPGRFLL
ncbi:unnamed protein product [Victoria cruziana]